MIKVSLVGHGYWGPKVLRNFASLPDCEVHTVCDLDETRLSEVQRRYPGVRTTTRYESLLEDAAVDAVVICTPVRTHYPLAKAAFEAGKHVLVEKPLTDSAETAAHLVEMAKERELVLQVDHTFLYSGAVQKIRAIIDRGEMGDLLYFDSVRINLGLFQSDVNVVWDLAPHDISIMTYLIDEAPLWVSAIGSTHYGQVHNMAYITMKFRESLIAHVHVNWLAPVKLRSTLLGGSRRMIVYDDLEPSEKIRIYDKGVSFEDDVKRRDDVRVDYRVGDMFAPYVEKYEPLSRACQGFLDSIRTGSAPLSDGRTGLRVVRILEAAQQSILRDGERIELLPEPARQDQP